jgi:hypothetical protein
MLGISLPPVIFNRVCGLGDGLLSVLHCAITVLGVLEVFNAVILWLVEKGAETRGVAEKLFVR